jgi:NAD+ synthase (glutamine-hydrolysing)
MKIAVCQLNSVIGDLELNKKKILEHYFKGVQDGVDLVICPELSLPGYTPQDLVEKEEFRNAVSAVTEQIAECTNKVGLIFGTITEEYDNVGTGLYNSAVLCYNGKIQFTQKKTLLPNYDVFDEVRYFESAKEVYIHKFNGVRLGISICEDIWNDSDYWKKRRYSVDPVQRLVDKGAELLINISASPYAYGKREQRKQMLSVLTKTDKIPLVYACCAGAQTDLIFDGGSMCFDKNGELKKLGKKFEEDYFIFDTDTEYTTIVKVEDSFEEEVLKALIFGVKEYATKTGFKKALLGLSGGIDSALVAYIAVKALGKENVHVVLMPSKYSSKGSIDDSLKLIKKLDISYDTLSIQPVFDTVMDVMKEKFTGTEPNIAEENIQSRTRGLYLMALSNKFNYLLCTTGNKSEIAVGYATLYGDMCGALAVIGDIYKTQVYKLANYINRNEEIIPIEIIEKAPSAELRPNQTDQDSLPPYDLLDKIITLYLEDYKELNEIIKAVGNEEIVKRTLKLVDLNEFKRKQAAPVLRVSTKAFGYGRRFPIVHGWKRNSVIK